MEDMTSMSEENKQSAEAEKDTIEIKKDVFEGIKSDMLKYKQDKKDLIAEINAIKEKLPAGEQKPVKDQILELLKEKEDTKTEAQLLAEQLQAITGQVDGLKSQLEQEKAEKLKMATENAIKAKATEMKFQNPDLVLKLIDTSGDIEAQLKNLAETQTYLIKQEPKNINQQTNFNPPPEDKSKWGCLDFLNNSKYTN